MQPGTKVELNQPKRSPWFTCTRSFQLGLVLGVAAGIGLSAAGSLGYLYVTKDSASVRDGQLTFNKPTTTTTTQNNPSVEGSGNSRADNGGVANSGDNSETSGSRDNSPSIKGNDNVVTLNITSNRELPGFDEERGYSAPPSDLSKYTKASDLQPDSLMQQASDLRQIDFEKNDIVILGKIYPSFFYVKEYAEESRFVFRLDGTQNAALLQFGLPDLTSAGTASGVYEVRISADDQLLWAGECKRSQGRQIISVPLDIPRAETLTIEVTSNTQNESPLYFTEARLFRN